MANAILNVESCGETLGSIGREKMKPSTLLPMVDASQNCSRILKSSQLLSWMFTFEHSVLQRMHVIVGYAAEWFCWFETFIFVEKVLSRQMQNQLEGGC